MGLAPYGQPKYVDKIFEELIDLKKDGSFHLNQKYFDYCTGLQMINKSFEELFSAPSRTPESLLTQFHMDVAASVQVACEEIVLRIVRDIKKETDSNNLCLAGGVALNCVANGRILREGLFDSIWIQPAAGDAGGALGAALGAYYTLSGAKRSTPSNGGDGMSGSMLGPQFSNAQIQTELDDAGAVYEIMPEDQLIDYTANLIGEGAAVGWFQGKMEFGPRALGGRSILADPRSTETQKTLNLKVKYRESFRPFAPSVLVEETDEWFDLDVDSPYMLVVAPVKSDRRREMTEEENELFGIDKLNIQRSEIPAVTHVDYSARVQTVSRDTNPLYYKLIEAFKALTGCPVLVNTSFNIRGEPIVCTPSDAFRCFMGTDLDLLVIGNCVLRKSLQNSNLRVDYTDAFDLD
jgi:carbamoyltransferase